MNIETLREYCLQKTAAVETFPFDEVTLVFKVKNKMFALVPLNDEALSINLKCEPERAEQLREEHDCVQPGFHMSKKHWNTVLIDGTVKDSLLREWIDHSYELVVQSLPRKIRVELE